MTNQVKNNLSTFIKTGAMLTGTLAAGRQLAQSEAGVSDSLTLKSGRALQQIGFTPSHPPPPKPMSPPAPPPPPASPYYDILANATVCGAVVPDWNHYGACTDANLNGTLSRIDLLAKQGCKVFALDLFETDALNTAAYNGTTMNNIQTVVNHAKSLNMSVLVGPSKDDVTMNDRVPTDTTAGLMVALANQFIGQKNVGLNVGGLPKNTGNETQSIAETYGNISENVRATGYKGLLTFTAPENDGRSGLNYFVPQDNRIQDANMRFVLYPYSGGNTTQALSWMQPCVNTLPCVVVTGLQVNATLGINNNIDQVRSELNFTRANGIPSLTTPWDSSAVLSSQGEQVMLTGDACNSNATVAISAAGQSLINLQKNITN